MSETPPKQDLPGAKPLRLLIVNDDADDLELCLRSLKKSDLNFEAITVTTREDFVRQLRDKPVDIVLSDYRMKGWTGIDALSIARQIQPRTPVILLSGTLGDELAVDCIKSGVTDYILKNQMARLPVAIGRAREEKMLREAEITRCARLRKARNAIGSSWRTHPRPLWSWMASRGNSSIAMKTLCASLGSAAPRFCTAAPPSSALRVSPTARNPPPLFGVISASPS